MTDIIDLEQFRKNREAGVKSEWPSAVTRASETGATAGDITPMEGPPERVILISTKHGDVRVTGHLGLSNTFLAIGDNAGHIKFACAPGNWEYVTDITDKEKPVA